MPTQNEKYYCNVKEKIIQEKINKIKVKQRNRLRNTNIIIIK